MSKREMKIEAMKEMKIDLGKKLERMLNEQDLKKLIKAIISTKTKKDITKMLNGKNIISDNDIVLALEKTKKSLINEIFDEPKKEYDMEEPIIDWLKKKRYKNYETRYNLPKVGRSRGGEIDVVGAKRVMLGNEVTGFELKCENSRSAIHKAFSQARSYQKYCDYVWVCFSPLLYAYHRDYIKNEIKSNKELGVMVVGKSRILKADLNYPSTSNWDPKLRKTLIEQIL